MMRRGANRGSRRRYHQVMAADLSATFIAHRRMNQTFAGVKVVVLVGRAHLRGRGELVQVGLMVTLSWVPCAVEEKMQKRLII